MGDMNIDLLKCGDHSKTNEYLNTVISHGYLLIITKSWRICSSSATLIGHIYTSDISSSRFLKREPWFTSGILTWSRTKSKLFAKKLSKPTCENIQKYKSFNNSFNTIKRKMKALYYRKILEDNKHDSKKCWSLLKQAIFWFQTKKKKLKGSIYSLPT